MKSNSRLIRDKHLYFHNTYGAQPTYAKNWARDLLRYKQVSFCHELDKTPD